MPLNWLTSGRLLARNVLMNVLGESAPLVAAFFSIPILIKSLGTGRFGVLTLAWVVVGYFSLFDIGLGRALTKLVAEKIGKENTEEIPSLIWTALALMGGLGLVGTAFSMALTPWLVDKILAIPALLQNETRISFFLLAASIPVVISTTGLRGVLQAYQRFDFVNAVRIPMGFFTFLGPLAVLAFSHSMIALVTVLVAGRVVAWMIHLVFCFRVVPTLKNNFAVQRNMVKPLLSFGGWLTVSNIVGPLMLYKDRFFISGLVSVIAVAFYTTPYEVVIKLLVLPAATLCVMFQAF